VRTTRQRYNRSIIAIPLTRGQPSRWLGSCDELAIVQVDKQKKIILFESVHRAPPHEPGLLPTFLDNLGIDELLLAGEMGPLAGRLLGQLGIRVVMNIQPRAREQIVRDYLSGQVMSTAGGLFA